MYAMPSDDLSAVRRDREDLLANYRAVVQQCEALQAAVSTVEAER